MDADRGMDFVNEAASSLLQEIAEPSGSFRTFIEVTITRADSIRVDCA